MKINKKITALLVAFFTLFCYADESGDNIFQNQKIEEGDFYDIQIEPSKQELKDGVSEYLESVKQKKLSVLKNLEAEKNKLNSSKDSLKSARDAQRELLEKKKAPKSKANDAPAVEETPAPEIKEPEQKKESEKTATAKNPPKRTRPTETKRPQKSQQAEPEQTLEEAEAKMTKSVSAREKFIDYGLNLRGIKYVWGGKTPNPGLDCSGLITYAAKNSIGLDLRGNAQDIYNQTVPIALANAEPGDLIFFKGENDVRITHVGIYLGKNPSKNDFGNQNLFLNAASGGPRTGVVISGLNENYWKKTFYNCGRIIDSVE